jgi:hypothetical protein
VTEQDIKRLQYEILLKHEAMLMKVPRQKRQPSSVPKVQPSVPRVEPYSETKSHDIVSEINNLDI